MTKHITKLGGGFAVIVLALAVSLYQGPDNASAAEGSIDPDTEIIRVYFPDRDMGNQIFLSFEGAMLETNYDENYHVMAATPDELKRLTDAGLGFEIDDEWQPPPYQAALLDASFSAIPGYPCYETVEQTFASAQAMADDHPSLAHWLDAGDSWEKSAGQGGYDMMVLLLTNTAIAGDKPKLFITCSIHAREYATAPLCLEFARQLLDDHEVNADATWILDHHEIHIMFHANPDGRKQAEAGVLWRKNTNENYCGPTSAYRGADLNRNFDYNWACCGGSSSDECSEVFGGPFAASEPEVLAIQDYMRAIFPDQRDAGPEAAAPDDATGVFIDMHSYSELVLWSWGWTPDVAPNGTQLQTLGRKLTYWNGYTPQPGYSLYPTDGTTKDFGYGELGVASYTFEIGTAFFQDCTVYNDSIIPDNVPALTYAAKIARTPYITPSGPNAHDLNLDGDFVPPGTPVVLTAVLDDTQHNNTNGTEPVQNIEAAEYYVDTPPWVSSPPPVATPMSPSDGNFDSPTEGAEVVIDTNGWSEGQHIIFVRGRDESGIWGAFSAFFLNIGYRDCIDDDDCNDDLFCNGAETCDVEIGCQSGTDPCPGLDCDEANDICMEPCACEVYTGTLDQHVAAGRAYTEAVLCDTRYFATGSNELLGENNGGTEVLLYEDPEGYFSTVACFCCSDSSDCDDGNPCNGAEICVGHDCQPGTPLNCDDGLFCTGTESCSAQDGCVSSGNPCQAEHICDEDGDVCLECTPELPCDDGLFCNGQETCVEGTCQPGELVDCNDGVACTTDACDEATDSCLSVPDDNACDDADSCTTDVCDASLGCINEFIPGCSACLPDGSYCSSDDECCSGDCWGFWFFAACR